MTPKIRTTLVLFTVFLLGTGIRAYRLDAQSLWNDEIDTFLNSNASFSELIAHPEINTNIPPLYYAIVHGGLQLGNHESVLRAPSLIFGVLGLLVLYCVTTNLLRRDVACIATFIAAISPFHVWYSQEARPYTVLLFLALTATWVLQQLLRGESHRALKPTFAILAAATFYCHTVGIAFIGFLVAYTLIVTRRQEWKKWLPLFGAIALLIVPAVWFLIHNLPTGPANSHQLVEPLLFGAYTIWAFGTGYSLGSSLYELHILDRASVVASHWPVFVPVMLFLCGLLLVGMLGLRRENYRVFWITILWAIFPFGFVVIGATLTSHPFNVRYTILSFPAFAILLAVGIQCLGRRSLRIGMLGVLVAISAASMSNYFFDQRYQRDNNRAAGEFLTIHALPDDLIIASAPYTAKNLRYYYSGDAPVVGYPPRSISDAVVEGVNPNSDAASAGTAAASLFESELDTVIAGQERFWLFLSHVYYSDPHGFAMSYCDRHFQRTLEFADTGVQLILYTRHEAVGATEAGPASTGSRADQRIPLRRSRQLGTERTHRILRRPRA